MDDPGGGHLDFDDLFFYDCGHLYVMETGFCDICYRLWGVRLRGPIMWSQFSIERAEEILLLREMIR